MTTTKQRLHRLALALCFSLVNWTILRCTLLPELSFWTYILVEFFLVFSMKMYILAVQKLTTSTNE